MGKGKKQKGVFKTKEIISPKQAGIYLSLLYGWRTSQKLTEIYEEERNSNGKKKTNSTITRYINYFKEKGWIYEKKGRIKFKTKKGMAYRNIFYYRANIKAFLDYLLIKSERKYEKLKLKHIQSILHLFFEFDGIINNILHNSIPELEKDMELNKSPEYEKNWEINFSEAVEGFKRCIDNNLIFYMVYFGKFFDIPEEIIETEKLLIKKYFSKTKLKVKEYLSKTDNSLFEERVEVINQFEEDFEKFKESGEYYDFSSANNIVNFININSRRKGIEYETKIRLFVGCLHNPKTFVELKDMFLGDTAKRLLEG
jgi:hypothetical protein